MALENITNSLKGQIGNLRDSMLSPLSPEPESEEEVDEGEHVTEEAVVVEQEDEEVKAVGVVVTPKPVSKPVSKARLPRELTALQKKLEPAGYDRKHHCNEHLEKTKSPACEHTKVRSECGEHSFHFTDATHRPEPTTESHGHYADKQARRRPQRLSAVKKKDGP